MSVGTACTIMTGCDPLSDNASMACCLRSRENEVKAKQGRGGPCFNLKSSSLLRKQQALGALSEKGKTLACSSFCTDILKPVKKQNSCLHQTLQEICQHDAHNKHVLPAANLLGWPAHYQCQIYQLMSQL